MLKSVENIRKNKVLRMGPPGRQIGPTSRGSILTLSRSSQLPYTSKKLFDRFSDRKYLIFPISLFGAGWPLRADSPSFYFIGLELQLLLGRGLRLRRRQRRLVPRRGGGAAGRQPLPRVKRVGEVPREAAEQQKTLCLQSDGRFAQTIESLTSDGGNPHETFPFIIILANPSRKNTLFCGCARLNIENMGEPRTKHFLL